MATKAKKRHTKKPLGFLVGLFCVAAFVMVFIGQENKLSAIEEEQAALSQEYEALELEKQRIEYMIEYAQSEEYILQYAREKLGFVKPDDIQFSVE